MEAVPMMPSSSLLSPHDAAMLLLARQDKVNWQTLSGPMGGLQSCASAPLPANSSSPRSTALQTQLSSSSFPMQGLQQFKRKHDYSELADMHAPATKRVNSHGSMENFRLQQSLSVPQQPGQPKQPRPGAEHITSKCQRRLYSTDCNGNPFYKNVTWDASRSRYRATVWVNKTRKHIGYFKGCEAAARAADQAQLCFFGEKADLNFPLSDYTAGTAKAAEIERIITDGMCRPPRALATKDKTLKRFLPLLTPSTSTSPLLNPGAMIRSLASAPTPAVNHKSAAVGSKVPLLQPESAEAALGMLSTMNIDAALKGQLGSYLQQYIASQQAKAVASGKSSAAISPVFSKASPRTKNNHSGMDSHTNSGSTTASAAAAAAAAAIVAAASPDTSSAMSNAGPRDRSAWNSIPSILATALANSGKRPLSLSSLAKAELQPLHQGEHAPTSRLANTTKGFASPINSSEQLSQLLRSLPANTGNNKVEGPEQGDEDGCFDMPEVDALLLSDLPNKSSIPRSGSQANMCSAATPDMGSACSSSMMHAEHGTAGAAHSSPAAESTKDAANICHAPFDDFDMLDALDELPSPAFCSLDDGDDAGIDLLIGSAEHAHPVNLQVSTNSQHKLEKKQGTVRADNVEEEEDPLASLVKEVMAEPDLSPLPASAAVVFDHGNTDTRPSVFANLSVQEDNHAAGAFSFHMHDNELSLDMNGPAQPAPARSPQEEQTSPEQQHDLSSSKTGQRIEAEDHVMMCMSLLQQRSSAVGAVKQEPASCNGSPQKGSQTTSSNGSHQHDGGAQHSASAATSMHGNACVQTSSGSAPGYTADKSVPSPVNGSTIASTSPFPAHLMSAMSQSHPALQQGSMMPFAVPGMCHTDSFTGHGMMMAPPQALTYPRFPAIYSSWAQTSEYMSQFQVPAGPAGWYVPAPRKSSGQLVRHPQYPGVFWSPRTGAFSAYVVQVSPDGFSRQVKLGAYPTAEDAAAAYDNYMRSVQCAMAAQQSSEMVLCYGTACDVPAGLAPTAVTPLTRPPAVGSAGKNSTSSSGGTLNLSNEIFSPAYGTQNPCFAFSSRQQRQQHLSVMVKQEVPVHGHTEEEHYSLEDMLSP